MRNLRTVPLAGVAVPALGQGTWAMGDDPARASRKGVARSCEASLARLRTDRLDLYLLHWSGSHPLEETVRGFEFHLLPWSQEHRVPVMAYSPIEQGRILGRKALREVARRLDATPAQVALAWVLRQKDVVAIPKAARVAHVRENHGALGLKLDKAALAALDEAFPPPSGPQPLEVI